MASEARPVTVEPICVGICRGATYGLFEAPDEIVAPARRIGARLVRIFLYWSQLEPERGRYDWTALDTFLDQLRGGDRAWITVAGSSSFGSRVSTSFLPPAPANDPQAYREFVGRLVRRAAGRVEFWQCEIEPCVPLMWAGSPQEYVDQLANFSAAVRQQDPAATVVLGAAVPMAMTDAPGSDERAITAMRQIAVSGAGLYDAFDIHPYGDAYQIGDLVSSARSMMAEAGVHRPILAGEYAGPMPTAYPQNLPAMAGVLADYRQTFGGQPRVVGLDPEVDHPELIKLYDDSDRLPDTLRMFLQGDDLDLQQQRDRVVSNELIIRTILLAAAGVAVVVPFQLAPERSQESPKTLRALMFGAFAMHDNPAQDGPAGGWQGLPRPAARAFALIADVLNGATHVHRIDRGDDQLFVFEIGRSGAEPSTLVAWRRDEGWSELQLPAATPGTVEIVDPTGACRTEHIDNDRRLLTVDATPQLIRPISSSRPSTSDRSPSWTDVN